MINIAVVAPSLRADSIAGARMDELTGQLASTDAAVTSLTAEFSDLEDARDKAKQEHDNLLKKVQTEAETADDHILAERDDTLSRYHGVLRFNRGIDKAVDVCNTGHKDTLTQLQLFFKVGRKIKADSSSTGPFQKGIRVAE